MANNATVTITTLVVARTSLREGVVTLRISVRTSLKKLVDWSHQPRTLLPPRSSGFAAMDLLVATFATYCLPLMLSPISLFVQTSTSNWQGRRDSNPQVR